MSGTIMTCHSGRQMDLAAPDPAAVTLADITHHLARLNRFCGATNATISVAQHSILVSRALEKSGPRLAMLGLLHDAHEAYMGEITTPSKNAIGRAAVEAVARRLDEAIWQAFNIRPGTNDAVTVAETDESALVSEWLKEMPGQPPGLEPPVRLPWATMGIEEAREYFLDRFHRLLPHVPGMRVP